MFLVVLSKFYKIFGINTSLNYGNVTVRIYNSIYTEKIYLELSEPINQELEEFLCEKIIKGEFAKQHTFVKLLQDISSLMKSELSGHSNGFSEVLTHLSLGEKISSGTFQVTAYMFHRFLQLNVLVHGDQRNCDLPLLLTLELSKRIRTGMQQECFLTLFSSEYFFKRIVYKLRSYAVLTIISLCV